LTLQWFDGGWGGACILGPGPEVYNICSVPRSSSAVALTLYQNSREVDRIKIWDLKLPKEYRKAVVATLGAGLRDPSIETATAFR